MLTNERIDELVQNDLGRVHASIYTDPEIFTAEMERIFYRTWNYIGHQSEISQPGDYKTTYIGQVPVIMSRDEAGEIHVVVNRCVHRGTTVCQWERGNSTSFRCEYHGWMYRNDGSLLGVTRRKGYGPAELAALPKGLDRVSRVHNYRGLIFANLDPQSVSFEDSLGVTTAYFDDWFDLSPTGELVVTGGVWNHVYEGNWKLGLEGSDERYHTDFLHQIFGVLVERDTGSSFRFLPPNLADLTTTDAGHGHGISEVNSDAFPLPWREMNPPEYVEALTARLGESRTQQVLSRMSRWHLFPNVAFGPENIRVIRPLGPDRTEVRQYHVALPDIPGVTERINRQRLVTHQKMYGQAGCVGPDDFEMFSRIQEGYRSLSCSALNPWVWFSRGLSTARSGPSGERVSEDQSELSQQAIYRGWVEMMKRSDVPGTRVPSVSSGT